MEIKLVVIEIYEVKGREGIILNEYVEWEEKMVIDRILGE